MGSPAQPLLDMRDKVAGWAAKAQALMGSGNGPVGKADSSWHDEMVRKATDSFTKPAQTKVASSPKTAAAKKKAPAKKTTRKRVAGK